MKRIRVAGIIPMQGGFALMHRIGVIKRKDYQEYYTFPGGGLEEGETEEEGAIREIKEELGINVKIVKKMYEMESEKPRKQILVKIDKENPNGSYRMLEKWGNDERKHLV